MLLYQGSNSVFVKPFWHLSTCSQSIYFALKDVMKVACSPSKIHFSSDLYITRYNCIYYIYIIGIKLKFFFYMYFTFQSFRTVQNFSRIIQCVSKFFNFATFAFSRALFSLCMCYAKIVFKGERRRPGKMTEVWQCVQCSYELSAWECTRYTVVWYFIRGF